MICPYCAEEIKDGATICRYCNRDLSFYAPIQGIQTKTTEIEEQVRTLSSHLDYLHARSDDVLLTRIFNIERDVQSIIAVLHTSRLASQQDFSINNPESSSKEEIEDKGHSVPSHTLNQQMNRREDQQRNQQGDTEGQQTGGSESRMADQPSDKAHSPTRGVARDYIDGLATARPEWRLIWRCVLFASLFAILGTQVGYLLIEILNTMNPMYKYVQGLKEWGYILATIFLAFVLIFPFMFGFRASLARPGGRFLGRLVTYLLLGLVVGLTTLTANFALLRVGGALGLTFEAYYREWQDAIAAIPFIAAQYLTTSGALFVLGALVADYLKVKKRVASRPAPS